MTGVLSTIEQGTSAQLPRDREMDEATVQRTGSCVSPRLMTGDGRVISGTVAGHGADSNCRGERRETRHEAVREAERY